MQNIPILILHGWNLESSKYIPLQAKLEKRGYKVYCPDLPGFGKTKLPVNSWFLTDYVDFVKKYLVENKLNKVVLIGHSFGGRIALKFAAENSKQLEALILTGVPGINPTPAIKIAIFLFLAKLGRAIFSFSILSSLRDFFRKFLYRLANATDYYNTNDYMLETFRNTVKETLIPYMLQINVPTLLLWGREDRIIPIGIAEKMNKIIKNSKLEVINEARHAGPNTHPREFADEIEKFLEKN